MRGYGAPSSGTASTLFGLATAGTQDWGYGDPNNGNVRPDYLDLGYGSVFPDRFRAVLVRPGSRLMPDSGGILIHLRMGAWPAHGRVPGGERSGPFLVRCVNASTGDVYPQDMFGCHSGRVGKEWNVRRTCVTRF